MRSYSIRQAVLPALLLTSCLGASAQECEVKVGVTAPMTGAGSAWGLAVKAGTEFQVALINSEGGLPVGNRKCKVKAVPVDGLCSAAGGAAASNKLASEEVVAVMGPQCSPEVTGYRPVAKRNGQIGFTMTYMKDSLTPEFPLIFHALTGPAVFAPILIKEAKSKFNFSSVVVLGPNDQGGTDAGRQYAKMFTDQGVKAMEEYYQRGTTNFAPIAARIMGMNPDLVEFGGTPPGDVATVVKALLESGYKGIFGGMGGIGTAPLLAGAGSVDKLRGYYWLELMPVDDPGARKLRVDFERLMKTPPPENALLYISSTATEQILRGISIAGTDRDAEKLAAALRGMKPESRYFGPGGWRGKTQYGINQELAFPIGMGVIADGKHLGVKRIEIPAE
jgi:branched-chain amino acid transport system substrate-binding protein